MCTSNTGTNLLPYGMKLNGHQSLIPFGSSMAQLTLDIQRAQLQDYTSRLQLGIRGYPNPLALNAMTYHNHMAEPYLHPYFYKDPRARFIHEEPKPNHSYIGLIAMGILSHRDNKLVLSDIYQWILDNYSYFRNRGPGWRNSIRHNLSLNDCFVKAGRSANGKGHYWAIHPANIEDFRKGDFRRRRAQRRVRKHMGLAVPDDDDSPSPSPSTCATPWVEKSDEHGDGIIGVSGSNPDSPLNYSSQEAVNSKDKSEGSDTRTPALASPSGKKRKFDMESLLAPDRAPKIERMVSRFDFPDLKDNCATRNETEDLDVESNGNNGGSVTVKNGGGRIDADSDPESYCESAKDSSSRLSSDSSDAPLSAVYKQGEEARCPSAFHSLGQYGCGSLPGYLSNFQVMALNAAGHRSLTVQGLGANKEASQKWQDSMVQYVSTSRTRDQMPDRESPQ